MPAWPTWAQVLNFWLGTIQPWAPASKSPRRWMSTPIQARLAGSLPTLLQPPSQLSQRRRGEMWGWRGGPPKHRVPEERGEPSRALQTRGGMDAAASVPCAVYCLGYKAALLFSSGHSE